MRTVLDWIRGWYETLRIRIFEPGLYRDLTAPLDIADFFEVSDPRE